jgi:hypothetical protein
MGAAVVWILRALQLLTIGFVAWNVKGTVEAWQNPADVTVTSKIAGAARNLTIGAVLIAIIYLIRRRAK